MDLGRVWEGFGGALGGAGESFERVGGGFWQVLGFPKWVSLALFLLFFSSFFLTLILIRFFFDFGGVLEANLAPKIDFWAAF